MESPNAKRALAFAASTNDFVKIDLDDLRAALVRYAAHDWGDVSADTRRYNQESLANGGQFYAQYTDRKGVTFYVTSTTSDAFPTVSLTREDE